MTAAPGPRFDDAGALLPPKDYRAWTYLTSGFAMGYGPAAVAARSGGVDSFDTVFVAPDAYRAFQKTGVWPESTMFVLEIRTAEETGSIVHNGRFQTQLLGIEAAVKDTRRFPNGGWGYFGFESDGTGPSAPAQVLPETAACYACHKANGAVEQTFTQFYPTLFSVARAKGTVRADFVGIPPDGRDVAAAIRDGGWPAGKKVLDDALGKWPDATVLREVSLTGVAYDLHGEKHTAEAIGLLEEIVRRFPASANAWDSLSEVYEAAGDRDHARTAVAQGLRALPRDKRLVGPRRAAIEKALRERQARLGR